MYKETTICKFQQGKDKLHLLKLSNTIPLPGWNEKDEPYVIKTGEEIYYQIRLNRKRIKTSKCEYEIRKLFAVITQNMVLQLKIY